MKYRVVRVDHGGKVHYEVQYRWVLGIWLDIQCLKGPGMGEVVGQWLTQEDAEKYIDLLIRLKKYSRKVVSMKEGK